MDTGPVANVVTFKLHTPACSFHFNLKYSHNHEDNMSIALLTVFGGASLFAMQRKNTSISWGLPTC